jgi:hypothetical protein
MTDDGMTDGEGTACGDVASWVAKETDATDDEDGKVVDIRDAAAEVGEIVPEPDAEDAGAEGAVTASDVATLASLSFSNDIMVEECIGVRLWWWREAGAGRMDCIDWS